MLYVGTLQDSVVSNEMKELFSAGFPASGGRFDSHYQVGRVPLFRLNGVIWSNCCKGHALGAVGSELSYRYTCHAGKGRELADRSTTTGNPE